MPKTVQKLKSLMFEDKREYNQIMLINSCINPFINFFITFFNVRMLTVIHTKNRLLGQQTRTVSRDLQILNLTDVFSLMTEKIFVPFQESRLTKQTEVQKDLFTNIFGTVLYVLEKSGEKFVVHISGMVKSVMVHPHENFLFSNIK